MYRELAVWWPLLSPLEGYEPEAGFVADLLRARSPRGVLELGSGGGHMAYYLKAVAPMTLVDLSDGMLAMSREINPECEHIVGDMRTVRLGRTFDIVFVHDAVMYMTTESDLAAALATAFAHCRPGGSVIIEPDCTLENFEPYTDHGGSDGADGRAMRYLEWEWDPDPNDNEVLTEYVFTLRDPDGSVTVEHETHRFGVFPRATWLRLLADAGFDASSVFEETDEDREMREVFIGRRPTT
jgi:SAM-dependent methyltransferase